MSTNNSIRTLMPSITIKVAMSGKMLAVYDIKLLSAETLQIK